MNLLDGIKVVDFSKWLPGQYCGMLLGDYGADVIKIEDLAGDTNPPRNSTSAAASSRSFRCVFRRIRRFGAARREGGDCRGGASCGAVSCWDVKNSVYMVGLLM